MKFLRFLLMSSAVAGVIAVTVAWSILATIGSATSLSHIFQTGGVYEYSAAQARQSLVSSESIPQQYREVVSVAVNSAITASSLEAVTKPLLVDIVSWMDQPNGTQPPDLIINVASIKQKIIASLQSSSASLIEKLALTSQVGKSIPDQLNLADASSFSSGAIAGAELTGPANIQQNPAAATLIQIKSGVATARTMIWVGLMLVLVALVCLVVVSRNDGRALLRRPAWACIIAAMVLALLSLGAGLMPLGASLEGGANPLTTIFVPAIKEVFLVMRPYIILVGVFGISLYGLSFVIGRREPTESAHQ